MKLHRVPVKDLQDLRQSIDQSYADAITEGLKEVVQIVNWQFAALFRRILVIEAQLGIPDDDFWGSQQPRALWAPDTSDVVVRDTLPSFENEDAPRKSGELPVHNLYHLLGALSDGFGAGLVDGLPGVLEIF